MNSRRFQRPSFTYLLPGWTWPRLIGFVVVVLTLGVLAEHVVEGHEPERSGDCRAKEISTGLHKEGTCFEGKSKLIVVDLHSTLQLESLDAKVMGIHAAKTISGPMGSKRASGAFATFDLAITNRTAAPEPVTEDQIVLLLSRTYSEDLEVERGYERRSFQQQDRKIPPHGTEDGTVTFAVPQKQAEALRKEGNLDIGNFRGGDRDFEPESIFQSFEYGVIRTYK